MISPSQHPELQIDALMGAYQGVVPGASLLVLQNGAPAFRRAYGHADLERRVAASTATNYRLASLSKQFTAAAILLLVEEGRLALDEGVRARLPALPDAAAGITIRHLLTHTSGLLDYEDLIPPQRSSQLHDADVLELLASTNRTYFAPGTGYRYSNSGYALLALAAEAASAMDFATLLRRRIFEPLHMRNTVAHREDVSIVPNRAFGYSAAAPSWVRTDQSRTSAVLGDGGIYSSIDDLEHWDAALYDERLLPVESLRRAFAPSTDTDDPRVQYGFGWRISGETLWHSGETCGFRNVIVRYPERHFTVILLTNRDDPAPYPLALAIAGKFL